MLPPKTTRPAMVRSGMYVAEDTLLRIEAIATAEKVKSRNKLMGSFLAFAVDLFPLLKPFSRQIEDFAKAQECTYAEAVARLVERALKAKK